MQDFRPRELREYEEQLAKIRDKESPREDASTSEGIKALITLHGGGCVSMLGFMQALINKGSSLGEFKFFGANALLFFAIGLVLTALIPAMRVLDVRNTMYASNKHLWWDHALVTCWVLSWVSFIVGLSFVGCGIQVAI